MHLVADLHIHTVASGHAYSTVLEVAQAAADKKLSMIAITDHGPAMPGGPHAYHFGNLKAIPDDLYGVRILKGIEANIMNRQGLLDLDDFRLARLDIVAAGLHTHCSPKGSEEENTMMMIAAMEHPYVDVIVHPGNPEYPIDEAAVVQAAARLGVALEINNSSLTVSRKGSAGNCSRIAELAKIYQTKLLVGTDSHIATAVGDFSAALQMLEEAGVPEELIINANIERVSAYLQRRNNHVGG